MPGTTQPASASHIKEGLLVIGLDLLFSQTERQGGKLVFSILEQNEDGDFLIELLRKDGTWARVWLTLNGS